MLHRLVFPQRLCSLVLLASASSVCRGLKTWTSRPHQCDPCNCYYGWARLFLSALLQDLQQSPFCFPLRKKPLLDAESIILPSKYFQLFPARWSNAANLLLVLSQPPSQQRAQDWRPCLPKTFFRPAYPKYVNSSLYRFKVARLWYSENWR